jgi:hypothetical protein
MKRSFSRIRAISSFIFDAGMSTRLWRLSPALRILVSMSAMGSDIAIFLNSFRPADAQNGRHPARTAVSPRAIATSSP